MDPQKLASTGIGMSGAGTAVGLAGDLFKGISSSRMYNYQAGISEMKAAIARQNADYATYSGHVEAGRFGLQARQRMGKIISAQGASGIDVGRGSNRNVQEGQKFVTEMDNKQIHANAARRAYGFELEAIGDEATAEGYKMAGRNALMAMPLNMASTFLTGSTSVASKWMQAKQTGIYTDDDPKYFYGIG